MRRCAVTLGILLWLAFPGLATLAQPTPALVLEVPEQVTVAGPKICLTDLGQLSGAAPAERVFWSGLELGPAPVPGQTRYFTHNYLEFILKQQKGRRRPVLRMGPRVAIRVAAVAVKGPAIAAAVDALLPPLTPGVVKQWVQFQNLPETVWLPQGKWRIEAALVGERLVLGTNIFKVKLVSATKSRLINLTGVFHKMALIYRANRNLAAKTELTTAAFDKTEVVLSSGREYTGDFPVGYRTIRSIRKGQVLLVETLQPLPQVYQGSEVQVTYSEGDIVVVITGIAKQDGWKGDRIALINPVSKKEFQGRVSGPGAVEVL
jgi:flagella basal body P-ring formation protein FlgA